MEGDLDFRVSCSYAKHGVMWFSGTLLFYGLFNPSAKVAKDATRRIRMELSTGYEVASRGGDPCPAPEEVATCVKCGAPTPPTDLLCRACYEARRPPVCPACGGRLVGGKCGWC